MLSGAEIFIARSTFVSSFAASGSPRSRNTFPELASIGVRLLARLARFRFGVSLFVHLHLHLHLQH
jgi:hypothetical protein